MYLERDPLFLSTCRHIVHFIFTLRSNKILFDNMAVVLELNCYMFILVRYMYDTAVLTIYKKNNYYIHNYVCLPLKAKVVNSNLTSVLKRHLCLNYQFWNLTSLIWSAGRGVPFTRGIISTMHDWWRQQKEICINIFFLFSMQNIRTL